MDKYFDKIYYINLDRDHERSQYLLKQFQNSIILPHLKKFSAIDGRSIKIEDIDNSIITQQARKDIISGKQRTYGVSLTYGSLGCALSHKKIFEECKNASKPYLIFEDDIILEKNFDDKLLQLIQRYESLPTFDIIYLGFHDIPSASKVKIDDVLSKPSGLTCGTYGYILSPTGAEKILNRIFPLNYQIDSSLSYNFKSLNVYCSTDTLVKMNKKFISNTQQKYSCQNIFNNQDDWNKLFGK